MTPLSHRWAALNGIDLLWDSLRYLGMFLVTYGFLIAAASVILLLTIGPLWLVSWVWA